MSLAGVKALTFDTGGTILDWHSGVKGALAKTGARHGIEKNWVHIANEFRRRSLGKMINLGEREPPAYNIDDAHRMALESLVEEHGLDAFTEDERHAICYDTMHNLQCWPDFPGVLPKLRENFLCASFTILSFRIIMDTARRNGLGWDAVFSCEAIGKYKILPEAYNAVAKFLQLEPGEICMVACHNFDLDAAKGCGFRTAFVKRPDEWGPEGPPDRDPNPIHDIVADNFPDMARQLGVVI